MTAPVQLCPAREVLRRTASRKNAVQMKTARVQLCPARGVFLNSCLARGVFLVTATSGQTQRNSAKQVPTARRSHRCGTPSESAFLETEPAQLCPARGSLSPSSIKKKRGVNLTQRAQLCPARERVRFLWIPAWREAFFFSRHLHAKTLSRPTTLGSEFRLRGPWWNFLLDQETAHGQIQTHGRSRSKIK